MGRPLTGVPRLVLGGPVRLGGLPTKACTRTPIMYTTSHHASKSVEGSDLWAGLRKKVYVYKKFTLPGIFHPFAEKPLEGFASKLAQRFVSRT